MNMKFSKASKIIALTALALISSKKNFAQCTTATVQDDFSTSSNWTVIDPSCTDGKIQVTSGAINFSNYEITACQNSANSYRGAKNSNGAPDKELRVFKRLKDQSNNFITLSNTNWTTEFKFRITDGNGPGHILMALTAGTLNPQQKSVVIPPYGPPPDYEPNPDAGDTMHIPSNQDGIFASLIAFGYNQEPFTENAKLFNTTIQAWDSTHMGSNTDPENMGWRIFGHAKNGADTIYPPNVGDEVAASNLANPTLNYSRGISLPLLNFDYYLRLERLNATMCKISVFKDATMTEHVLGSPQCFEIEADITGLNTVQNATFQSGNPFRSLSGTVDDLKIFDNCNPDNLTASITGNSTFCQGTPVTVTGLVTGNLTTEHFLWEIDECNQYGNLINPGTSIHLPWDQGTLGTAFNIPGSETLPCDKYYRVTLAVQNLTNCLPWQVTSKIIRINCKPTPVISGNTNICYGGSTMLCVNDDYNQPSPTYTLTWGPKKNKVNCITTSTLATSTIFSVTVTNTVTGCVGQSTVLVNVSDNNPDFLLGGNMISSTIFTCHATPVSQTASSNPNFHYDWTVEEISLSTGLAIPTSTVYNPNCWWNYGIGTNEFSGYNGTNTVNCSSSSPGQFLVNHKYRVTRGTWITNTCQWQGKAYSIYLCSSCKTSDGNPMIITEEDPYTPGYNYTAAGDGVNTAMNLDQSVLVYPNPSTGLINIHIKNANDKSYAFEVFDVFGKLIYKKDEVNTQGSEFKTEINLSDLQLSSGLYLVNVSSENQVLSQRIMIEK